MKKYYWYCNLIVDVSMCIDVIRCCKSYGFVRNLVTRELNLLTGVFTQQKFLSIFPPLKFIVSMFNDQFPIIIS